MLPSLSILSSLFLCYSAATKRSLTQCVLSAGLKLTFPNLTKNTVSPNRSKGETTRTATFSTSSGGYHLGLQPDGSQPRYENEPVNDYLCRVYLGTARLAQDFRIPYGSVSKHWKRTDVPLPAPNYAETRLYYYLGDMITLGMKIRQSYPAQRWAVEDFANGFTPGGGVLNGARAQEESMCRRSTLYPLLRRLTYPLGDTPTGLIVAGAEYCAGTALLQDVTFFRGGERANFACAPQPVTLDVIAVAAPHFPRAEWGGGGGVESAAPQSTAARAVTTRITRNVICAAGHGGCRGVIVGMLGGGAFNGDPQTIIEGTIAAVKSLPPGVVKTVIFAVIDDHNNARAVEVTRRVMRARGVPRLRPAAAPGAQPPGTASRVAAAEGSERELSG